MQQDNGGGGGDNNKPQNQQDRRLKPIMQGGGGDQNNQNQQQQPQPQKCPRCESVNTKFCYYNNYSLSQPRFFCKTCRRYWTQGGTLRNVPVGGGCRKGKRTKTSSSSSSSGETSRSSQPPPQPPLLQIHQNLTNPLQNMILSSSPVLRSKESGNLGSYYPSGGFLSSLSAIQTLNPPAQSFNLPLNQPLNAVGGGGGGGGGGGHGHLGGGSSSNLDLLQGFNVPSFVSQPPQHPQQIHQTQFFQMGNRPTMYHLHQPSQEMSLMNHSNRPGGGSSSQHQHQQQQQQDWHQSFFNSTNTNPNVVSDTALWSISTSTSTSGNTNSNSNTNTGSASVSASLNPNQWPDLSGYGAPPP